MNTTYVSKHQSFIKQDEPVAMTKQELAAARKAIAAYRLRDETPTVYNKRKNRKGN